MIVPVKIDGKNFNLPGTWSDLDLQTLLKIDRDWDREKQDPVELLSILTGLQIFAIDNIKEVPEFIGYLNSFSSSWPNYENMTIPRYIEIDGHEKPVMVPRSLGEELFGQKVMLDQYAEQIEDWHDLVPKVLSVYLITKTNPKGEYDRERLPILEQQIMRSNGLKMIALATFFLTKTRNLIRFGKNASQQLSKRETLNSGSLQEENDSDSSDT